MVHLKRPHLGRQRGFGNHPSAARIRMRRRPAARFGIQILAIGAPTIRPAVDIVLKTFAILFEAKRFAAFAAPLVDAEFLGG